MIEINSAAYIELVLLNITCDCGHTIDSYLNHCRKRDTWVDYTTEDCVLCEVIFKG